MKKILMLVAVFAAGVLLGVTPKFDKVPNAALQHLKGVRGKPVRKGVVFVNGRYMPPPYTVWRKGTAVYIGNTQVTGEVVPWSAFVLAQNSDGAPAPRREAPKKPDASAKSVDDLFGDGETEVKKEDSAPEPVLAGPFTPNVRTKRYLKRINDYRTEVDRRLRRGEILFFGSRYSMLHVEDRLCMPLMNALPQALRDARNPSDLQSRLRARGITYFGNELCEDLFANQATSFAIDERRAKMQEEADTFKLLDAGSRGVVR